MEPVDDTSYSLSEQFMSLGIDGSQPPSTINMDDISSIIGESLKAEKLMYAGTFRPKPIAYGNSRTNKNVPGWAAEQAVIFYQCYVKGISHDCNLAMDKLSDFNRN